MAMVRLVLGYEHDIGLRYVRKVRNTRRGSVFREQPFSMPHQGGTGEPWIDENGECSWSSIETWR